MNTSWCNSIIESISHDSNWIARIPFQSVHASTINNIIQQINNIDNSSLLNQNSNDNSNVITSKHDFTNKVDLVELLSNNNFQLNVLLNQISSENNYPNNAIFRFDNYVSMDAKNQLVMDISSAALEYGTVLTILKTNKKTQRNPFYNLRLACIHFGDPRLNKTCKKKGIY